VVNYASLSADAIGSLAARTAGSRPPANPISTANTIPAINPGRDLERKGDLAETRRLAGRSAQPVHRDGQRAADGPADYRQ
jgi:hypothetical protein